MKRNTVSVDCKKINPKIKENGWSNASFSRLVGKYPSWYGEVKRGNNLPSPEEAAKMCILLQTTPEDILLEPDDIARVKDLLGQEKGTGKAPGQEAEGGTQLEQFVSGFSKLNPQQRDAVLALIKGFLSDRA